MMKQMQYLEVVERLFPLILSGNKTSTIRWRELNIIPGPLRFVCDADARQQVIVEVHRCTNMHLSEAASFIGKTDEWPDDVMLDGMREHYPDIQISSVVQVIEFTYPATR